MKLPYAQGRVVPPRKIAGYLLDAQHARGRSKAAFFERFGFSADAPGILAAALHAHPERNDVVETVIGPYGTSYAVRCAIETPDGRNPCILSVWFAPRGEPTKLRLSTAYPAA